MIDVGYELQSKLETNWHGFPAGADEFVRWLSQLRSIPAFDIEWMAQWEKAGPKTLLFLDPTAYIQAFADRYDVPDATGHSIWAHDLHDGSENTKCAAKLRWQSAPGPSAEMRVLRADPRFGTNPAQYIEMIRITTTWQRPKHLDFSPTLYRAYDHPLDRTRRGIGWMGWIPFTLTPADVPEAALVMAMNGGTFIQSVPDFWQAPHLPRQPDAVRDEATIARVQDVEIRLNLLGVLPTADDLASGNWGR